MLQLLNIALLLPANINGNVKIEVIVLFQVTNTPWLIAIICILTSTVVLLEMVASTSTSSTHGLDIGLSRQLRFFDAVAFTDTKV